MLLFQKSTMLGTFSKTFYDWYLRFKGALTKWSNQGNQLARHHLVRDPFILVMGSEGSRSTDFRALRRLWGGRLRACGLQIDSGFFLQLGIIMSKASFLSVSAKSQPMYFCFPSISVGTRDFCKSFTTFPGHSSYMEHLVVAKTFGEKFPKLLI